jgi:hypothetical protein
MSIIRGVRCNTESAGWGAVTVLELRTGIAGVRVKEGVKERVEGRVEKRDREKEWGDRGH